MTTRASALSALLLLSACAGGGQANIDPGPMQTDCAADHDSVGLSGELSTLQHGVDGTATIIDDCTIEIEGFTYDGQGVDTRFVIDLDDSFGDYTVISEALIPDGPYEDETITVPLPEGVTLDDVGALSVWCVPFEVDFGSVVFESVL
ncbi:MAG: DM13 domain-containing protein [Proteobacteria bacterium]|nr:DM13 domain-containing protein [Pseudomonadota bacterium]